MQVSPQDNACGLSGRIFIQYKLAGQLLPSLENFTCFLGKKKKFQNLSKFFSKILFLLKRLFFFLFSESNLKTYLFNLSFFSPCIFLVGHWYTHFNLEKLDKLRVTFRTVSFKFFKKTFTFLKSFAYACEVSL